MGVRVRRERLCGRRWEWLKEKSYVYGLKVPDLMA